MWVLAYKTHVNLGVPPSKSQGPLPLSSQGLKSLAHKGSRLLGDLGCENLRLAREIERSHVFRIAM